MPTTMISGKAYEVDELGFLASFGQWDENFAKGLAGELGIVGGLTDDHWKVIRYIHGVFEAEGRCPLVFQTCKSNSLHLKDLSALFPSGYLRGACKLAGITYREGYHGYGSIPASSRQFAARPRPVAPVEAGNKTYTIDLRGFLVDASEWDMQYAIMRAADMKMGELLDRHWTVIRWVRAYVEKHGEVPTVYETCAANDMDYDDLGALFPDGYHRGLIKIAGLRVI